MPQANAVGVLINPNYPVAASQMREVPEAAARLGVPIILLTASAEQEIDAAFSTLLQKRAGALLVCNDPFFGSQSKKLVSLALQYALRTMYFRREFVEDGGIISYGPPIADGYHQAGVSMPKRSDKSGDIEYTKRPLVRIKPKLHEEMKVEKRAKKKGK